MLIRTHVTSSARLILSSVLILGTLNNAFAYRNDDQAFAYQPPNPVINDFQNNYNNQQFNYRPQINLPSFSNLQTPLSPNLTINAWTMRLPEINVVDVGNSVWSFQKESDHFNPETKSFDSYQADIKFKFDDVVAERSVSMDLGKMKFDQGSFAPREFKRVYSDERGNTLVRERTNQTSQTNDSYNRFVQFYEREERLSSANQLISPTAAAKTRPVDPPVELINGFDEKWKLSVMDDDGIRNRSTVDLRIDSIKNESNLHRFISEYTGTIKTGPQTIRFTVTSPHESNGDIQSLSFKLEGKGSPSATITWKPVQGKTDEAFSLLRENLPAPILVGPRSNFRLNGVDLVETPLRVTAKGDLSSKQLGQPQDLVNLIGKEDLGINISFSAPNAQSSKSSFSLGNSIRNLWYMATGRWAEIKDMRQQMTAMKSQEPGKFVLAAGFSDPSFMGIKDLRAAVTNSKEINLPHKYTESFQAMPTQEFKSFTDPKGRNISFEAPLSIVDSNGSLKLQEPVKLPSAMIPADVAKSDSAQLTKATFKLANNALIMTEGVAKIGQEKYFIDSQGEFTNVKVFEQGLAKIETAENHLQTFGDRLTKKLDVAMNVTNNYLQNLHGVTGQILTEKIVITDALSAHGKEMGAFSEEAMQLRTYINIEDYSALQHNLPGMHEQQMNLMKQEQQLGSQVKALGNFSSKLQDLTSEAKTLLPKINFDHMLTEFITDQKLQFNSQNYFGDDKKILSNSANDVLDSLSGLAEAGLIDHDTAKDWGKGIINARDRFMVSVPRMSYEIDHTIDSIKNPGDALSYAVNRKADAMFFDRWNRMVDKNPEGMVAFSTKGLLWSKIAYGGSLVAGVIDAPIAMAAMFGTGLATEKALESMGVKTSNAKFYGAIVGILAGAKISSPEFLMKVGNAWKQLGAILENVEFGLPGMSRSLGKLMNSERGSILVHELPGGRAPPREAGKIANLIEPEPPTAKVSAEPSGPISKIAISKPATPLMAQYTKESMRSLPSFSDDVAQIAGNRGLTMEEFYRLLPEPAVNLSPKQQVIVKSIRDSVPMPTKDTLLEKAIPKADIQKYLDGKYTDVRGFVNRSQDSPGVKDFKDLYNSMRLDYEPKTMAESPAFNLSDDSVGIIRFKTPDIHNVEIPYSKAMGGTNSYGEPFTGNGFTASVNGKVIPEFKLSQNATTRVESGAEIYEVFKNGEEILRGIYKNGRFIQVGKP